MRFSTDAGGNWTEIPTACTEQEVYVDNCSYVGQLVDPEVFAVDPLNRNTVLIGTIGLYRTTNAGSNWQAVRKQNNFRDLHVDHHAIAFSQATPGLVYVGNDGGIWKSTQHGAVETWDNLNHNLPGSLLFSVALGQDGSMMAGTMDNGSIFYDAQGAAGVWQIVLGGDGFQALINPTNSEFSYYIINSGSFRRYQRSVPEDADIYPRLSGSPVPCAWSWSLNPLVSDAYHRRLPACRPDRERHGNFSISRRLAVTWVRRALHDRRPYHRPRSPKRPKCNLCGQTGLSPIWNTSLDLANAECWQSVRLSDPHSLAHMARNHE